MDRVLVIGGGASGMAAASKAKRMKPDLEVIVCEASRYVSYAPCGIPYYIAGIVKNESALIHYTAEFFREKRGIDVRTQCIVEDIDPKAKIAHIKENGDKSYELEFDKLVIATGASPIKPPIEGVDLDGIYTVRLIEDGLLIKEKLKKAEVISAENEPTWEVVNYNSGSITIYSKIVIDGYIAGSTDLIGVFVNDECRGKGYPEVLEGESVEEKGCSLDEILEELDSDDKTRLYIIHSPKTENLLTISRYLVKGVLERRRESFRISPYILFVFDEAQEFIPQRTVSDLQKEVNKVVEELLRQGRKYGLGACIATQRVAYLNTTAIQQLHTFFVGTIPRHYDRKALADAFPGPEELLDETLTLNTGEWLLMSYVATGLKDIPIFLKADNTEDIIDELLKTIK